MLRQNPKISVIIPTYNRADLITRAISSVLNQTYKSFEIIVIDDGSTDNTKEVLKSYIEKKQIKYLYQQNHGPAAARNLGIKYSKGELIAFLDSDDEWLPEKLEKQIKIFNESKNARLGVVYCDVAIMEGRKQIAERRSIYKGKIFPQILEKDIVWGGSSAMVNRKIFSVCGNFDENLPESDDWELWIRVSKKFNFDFVPEVLVKQYVHPGSLSVTIPKLKKIKAYQYILKKFLKDYQNNPKIFSNYLCHLGSLYCQAGNISEGQKLFIKALSQSPLNMNTYLYFLVSFFGPKIYKKLVGINRLLRRTFEMLRLVTKNKRKM